MANLLHLNLNAPQSRVKRGRIAAFTQGGYKAEGGGYVSGWSDIFYSNTLFDTATYTLFLLPSCFDPAFRTSNTGAFVKLGLSDYTLDDSSNWKIASDAGGLPYMMHAGNASGLGGVTTTTFGKNRGFYFAYFRHSIGNEGRVIDIEVGFNVTYSGASGPSFKFYSDGSFEFWKDGSLVETATFSNSKGDQPATQTEKWVEIALLPARDKEWLIISNVGGSVNVVDNSIDDSDPARFISPDTNFWFYFHQPVEPKFLSAPITYPTTGYRCSKTLGLCDDPTLHDGPNYSTYWDPAYAGAGAGISSGSIQLVSAADGASAYTYASDRLFARLRFNLTGNGSYTPWVYGAVAEFDPITVSTTGTPEDLVDSVVECSLDVPEHAGGVSLHFEGRNPDGLTTGSFMNLGNQPLQMLLDDVMVIDGRTDVPENEIVPVSDNERFKVEVRDRWKQLEKTSFKDPLPLDQLTLKNALLKVLAPAGVGPGDTDIYDDGYTLDKGASPSLGDWACLVDVGQEGTVAKWIERLMETFAGNWYYGFKPVAGGGVPQFFAKPPDQLGASKITLYQSIKDAIDAGFPDSPERYVFRKFRSKPLEPEGNILRITGYDPRLRRAFQAVTSDDPARDPALAPGSRPANWAGEDYEIAYLEPLIQTDAAAARMISMLFPRISKGREPVEWEAELQTTETGVPIWRGDVITLDGIGDYVVNTLSCHFIQTVDESGFLDRPTTYTGELLSVLTA